MNYSDLTILIPVRIDSPDRLRNVHALTDSLKRLDGVRIIVLEADSQPRIEQIDGVQLVFGYSDITMNNNRKNEIDRLFDTASVRLGLINKVRNAYH